MSDFRISIIIPTFNEEENLERLAQHIMEKSAGWIAEIIVADGGSTDKTIAAAEKHGWTTLTCKKKGRAAQMNEGAEAANSPILYFLHADTLPPKNFDKKIVHAVQSGKQCGCFRLSFDDPHPVLRFYSWCTRFPTTYFRFGDQSLFVLEKLFRQVGGFDDSLKVMEDQAMVRSLKNLTHFSVMENSVVTSARLYKKNGVIKLQFIFTIIVILYYLGAGQEVLVKFYQTFIHK